jgi:hypothetical protein
MSLIDFGAGSQELASLVIGCRSVCTSDAQASESVKSLHRFGLCGHDDRLGPAVGSVLLENRPLVMNGSSSMA